jgi:mannose-6-phosphate isomerase-like protein (cupin superfamily)
VSVPGPTASLPPCVTLAAIGARVGNETVPSVNRMPGGSVKRMGWAASSVDELGNETFRKVRRELGINAFGANVLVLQPGITGRPHYHDEQDELYFVHEGRAIFDLPDDRIELGPGGMLHVESKTARLLTNPGPDELVMLVIGAKDGYVGRDGQPAKPKAFLRDLDAD